VAKLDIGKKEYTPTKTTHEVQVMALALCIATNTITVIWGPPGAGKTSALNAISASTRLHLEQILASTKEPPDFAGFPFINDGIMRLAPPAWAHNIIKAHQERKQLSIAFFDELSTAVPATQAAVLTTILDRKAGEAQMPMGTRMIAAANPPKIAANGWDLTPPMANRFTHLDWELDAKTIARGLQLGWKTPEIPRLPSNMKALVRNAEILVGSYIESRPQAVEYDFSNWSGNSSSQDFRAANNAWPSARSWTVAAKLFAAGKAARLPDKSPLHDEVTRILLEGTVGVAQATEFLTYAANLDLPNPVELLNNPSGYQLPERGDHISATLAAVHHEAISHQGTDIYAPVWVAWGDILTMVVDAGKGDISFAFVQDWMRERPQGVGLQKRHRDSLGHLLKAFGDIDNL
jgi:MoxR-like ATPase